MTNLSASATANSYIVNVNSRDSDGYYFTANVAGNGNASATDYVNVFREAEEIYPSGGGSAISGNGVRILLNQNRCISDVFFSNNRIYFKASGNRGNAKVTLTNNGTSVWTWHIWCTDQPGTYSVNGYTVMDRNMGAYDEIRYSNDMSCGLYYPYGFPIGFTVEEYSNGREVTNLPKMRVPFQNPEYPYLKAYEGGKNYCMMFNPWYANNAVDVWGRMWGNGQAKTIYDPCPPGYKVTPYAFWDSINNNSGTLSGHYYGFYAGSAFFPFNGRVYKGGIESMDIVLGGRNYPNNTTRGYRAYMWSSSSYVSNIQQAWYYHIRRSDGGDTNGNNATLADSAVNVDILTRGMGVRCVAGN